VGASSLVVMRCVISRVGLTEGRRSHNGGRGGVFSSCTPTALGMVLQCPGWRRGSEDGRTRQMVTEEMCLTGPTSRRHSGRARDRHRPLFEGSVVLFRGCGARAVREWVAQCHRADTDLTAQCRTVAGMASPGGLAKRRRDMIHMRVRGTAWRGFIFDFGVCMCQNINAPVGSGCGSGEPMRVSSEAGSRSRGCLALERGGVSPEGASSPRARRSFISAVLYPSSETESHPRGAGADRSGGPPRP
jgi:hypothetical protein